MVDSITPGLQLIDQQTGNNNNTWGDVADANWAKIESSIVGLRTNAATTGGTLPVMTDDEARPYVQNYVGGLLSNLVIIVPNRLKSWLFVNNTTGAFTMSVKTAAQATGLVIPRGGYYTVFCDGANVFNGANPGVISTGPLTGVASGSTVDLGAQGSNTVYITGTATINSFGTAPDGTMRYLLFEGGATIVHSASIINFGQRNILTQSGDWAIVRSTGADWRMLNYQRLDGTLDGTQLIVSGQVNGGSFYCTGFQISNSANYITMNDTDWGVRHIHHNGGSMGFLNNGGGWAMINDNAGNLTATANSGAYSDVRLKTDIVTVDKALALIEQLRGVRYARKDSGMRRVGVIAQEIQRYLPEVVYNTADGMLAVNYGDIVGVLIEAVKELSGKVRLLQAEAQRK
jgi:hypothetical protein